MARTPTTKVNVTVPVELLEAARRCVGEGTTPSEAVRRALAELVGVDPERYPVRPGRPWPDRAGGAAA